MAEWVSKKSGLVDCITQSKKERYHWQDWKEVNYRKLFVTDFEEPLIPPNSKGFLGWPIYRNWRNFINKERQLSKLFHRDKFQQIIKLSFINLNSLKILSFNWWNEIESKNLQQKSFFFFLMLVLLRRTSFWPPSIIFYHKAVT